jgi:hypothetical protein
MPLVEVRGERELLSARPILTDKYAEAVGVKVKDAIRLDRARAAGRLAEHLVVADDDVVEIDLSDGQALVQRWIRGSDLAAELGTVPKRSRSAGGDELVVEIPDKLPRRGQTRGGAALVLKGLRVLGVDPVRGTAVALAQELEKKLVPEPGVYHWDSTRALIPITKPIHGTERILLFLHGTASKTAQGFGALIMDGREQKWAELCAEYEGRVYALEHKTLTESPIKNAIDALEMMPEGATLHLVSHSRGGLIGELLCRGKLDRGSLGPKDEPFTPDEIDVLAFDGQKMELRELAKLLKKKKPKVERFIRVACPARGTILASERLDRYLTVFLNVLGYIPILKTPVFKEVYDFLKAFLLAVVKERTRPESIPGLEAMIPSSPFQKIINRRDVIADADLSVIKGDLEGQGLFDLASLKAFATDLFYREDHDLVVNTAAMDGGMARKDGAYTFFDQGPTVDHFNYFRNTRTVDQMMKMLHGEIAGLPKITPRSVATPSRAATSMRGRRRPAVFIVPDFGGTLLSAQGRLIWPDDSAMAAGEIERLAIDRVGVVPEGLLDIYYGDLIKELAGSHDVEPFPYDWRLSLADEGKRLDALLDQRLRESTETVSIVAHGVGGLLVRAVFSQNLALWQRFTERKDSRVVLLGVPHGGSYALAQMLIGRDQMAQMLQALDFKHSQDELLKLLGGFPGVLEALPRDGDFDLLSDAGWQRLYAGAGIRPPWSPPDGQALEAARKARAQIDGAPFDLGRMLYVTGQNITVDGIATETAVLQPDLAPAAGVAAGRIVFRRTQEGDGRAPWKSSILPGMRTWYSAAAHGDLPCDPGVICAVVDLLINGNSEQLPQAIPTVSHLEASAVEIEPMEVFPQAA